MLRQEPHTLEFFSDYPLASNSVTKNNNNKHYNLAIWHSNQRKHQEVTTYSTDSNKLESYSDDREKEI